MSVHNTFIATMFDWDHRSPKAYQVMVNKVLKKLGLPMQLVPAPPVMANVEARMNLYHLLDQVIAYQIPGDIVELGCNAGESTIVMQKLVAEHASDKRVFAFDSFEGLPELSASDRSDAIYDKGYMATSLDTFKENFKAAGVPIPEVHKGWFEETVPTNLPDKIAFALIDGDLYESTRHVLPHIYERMAPGAIGMFAVYYDETVFPREDTEGCYRSPGVKRATDEFFADKPEQVAVLYANEYSNGFFRKLM